MDANNFNNNSIAPQNYNYSNPILYTDTQLRQESVYNTNSGYQLQNQMPQNQINENASAVQNQQMFSNATIDISSSSLNIPGIGKLSGVFASKPTGEINFITQTPDNHQLIFLLKSVKLENSNTEIISPTLISVISRNPNSNYIQPMNFYPEMSNNNPMYFTQQTQIPPPNNFLNIQANQICPPPLKMINVQNNIQTPPNQPPHVPIEAKHGNIQLKEVTPSQAQNIGAKNDHEFAFSRFVAESIKGIPEIHITNNKPNIQAILNNKWSSLTNAQREIYYQVEPTISNTNPPQSLSKTQKSPQNNDSLKKSDVENGGNINFEHSYIKNASTKTAAKLPLTKLIPVKKICSYENCKTKIKPKLGRKDNYCSDECAILHSNIVFKKSFMSIILTKNN